MSFYDLSFPPNKTALFICYKDDADALFQEQVESGKSSDYETSVLKLHTKFNPASQIATYIQREYPKGVDYLYFRYPGKSFSKSENIQGFARQTMIRICKSVKASGVLVVESCEEEVRLQDFAQFCLPDVTIKYSDARVVKAIEAKDIEEIKRFCKKGDLLRTVLCSNVVSPELLNDLFLAVVYTHKEEDEERLATEWGGFEDPGQYVDRALDSIVQKLCAYGSISQDVLDAGLQDAAKYGRARMVSIIMSAGKNSPDVLGSALQLAADNGWLEVMEWLLAASNAEKISEKHLVESLEAVVVWLPGGGSVAREMCNQLVQTGRISKKELQALQEKMQNLKYSDATQFLEDAIQEIDAASILAHEMSWR